MYSDEVLIRQAFQAGASAYVLKGSDIDELLLAIQLASLGGRYFSPSISEATLNKLLRQNNVEEITLGFDSLSRRERATLQLIAEGNSNRRIAEELKVSVKTTEKDRASLMSKLDVNDVPGMVRIAIQHSLIILED